MSKVLYMGTTSQNRSRLNYQIYPNEANDCLDNSVLKSNSKPQVPAQILLAY